MVSVQEISDLSTSQLRDIDVVCMGHFNVLHPGHFRFLDFASSKGRKLCVILKGDDEFSTNEKNHYFSEKDRALALMSFKQVKHVVVRRGLSIKQCLKQIKPRTFVLGHEFERERYGEVTNLVEDAKKLDISVLFHSGDRNSKWVNLYADNSQSLSKQEVLSHSFLKACNRRQINFENIKNALPRFSSLKTLIVGDLIVDEFVKTDPLGLSSEAPVVVVKEIEKFQYIGGAGIVAAHVAALGPSCHFLSVSGDDEARETALGILGDYKVSSDILIDKNRPTTFKRRYLAENQKLFRVSRLVDTDIEPKLENKLIQKIYELAPELDNIIVSDFVYGVITDRVLAALNEVAKKYKIRIFGDLQCSSQVGSVLKFQKFSMIFPTEKEARISINSKDDGLEFMAQKVFEKSKCQNLVIKLGADGLVAYDKRNDFIESEHFPALSANAVDVSGAGDSVLATIATAKTAGMDLMSASALGSVVASCSVEALGNSPLDIDKLAKKLEVLHKQQRTITLFRGVKNNQLQAPEILENQYLKTSEI